MLALQQVVLTVVVAAVITEAVRGYIGSTAIHFVGQEQLPEPVLLARCREAQPTVDLHCLQQESVEAALAYWQLKVALQSLLHLVDAVYSALSQFRLTSFDFFCKEIDLQQIVVHPFRRKIAVVPSAAAAVGDHDGTCEYSIREV